MDDVLVGQTAAGAAFSWGEHLRGDGGGGTGLEVGKQGQHRETRGGVTREDVGSEAEPVEARRGQH